MPAFTQDEFNRLIAVAESMDLTNARELPPDATVIERVSKVLAEAAARTDTTGFPGSSGPPSAGLIQQMLQDKPISTLIYTIAFIGAP